MARRGGRNYGLTNRNSPVSNMRPLDRKGRNVSRKASRPTYKGPKTSRAAQKRTLTRNH